MEFPILVRWHFYIDSAPSVFRIWGAFGVRHLYRLVLWRKQVCRLLLIWYHRSVHTKIGTDKEYHNFVSTAKILNFNQGWMDHDIQRSNELNLNQSLKLKWPNITKKSTDCAFYLSNSSAVIDHYSWEFKWHYNCIRKQIIFLQQLFRTSGIHKMFVLMVGVCTICTLLNYYRFTNAFHNVWLINYAQDKHYRTHFE